MGDPLFFSPMSCWGPFFALARLWMSSKKGILLEAREIISYAAPALILPFIQIPCQSIQFLNWNHILHKNQIQTLQ